MKNSQLIVCFIVISFFNVSLVNAVIPYVITDVGTLPGHNSSYAYDINARGQIVGSSKPLAGYSHGFFYSNGTMIDIGDNSEAIAINNNGQIVGQYMTSSAYPHAYCYSNGAKVDLGVLSGLTSFGWGINSSGQVVGTSNSRAFLYSGGSMTDLGNLGKTGNAGADDINDNGEVVGYSLTPSGVSHAFLYSNGTMNDLGTLPGFTHSRALRINANGQVAGYCDTTSGDEHAFLYDNGIMNDLGTLPGYSSSSAIGLNTNGQVVGKVFNLLHNSSAFLYSNGTMIDLNSLIDPSSGWNLFEATAINDSGWIVGQGKNNLGQTHIFLLTPVPEPSTIALLGMGGIGLMAFAWRHRKTIFVTLGALAVMTLAGGIATADTFGTGANQLTIDFVPISGATNPTGGISAGDGFTFAGVHNDYRMGAYEITNVQWDRFKAAYGMPAGSPLNAYDGNSSHTGANVPTDGVSWYEAAQFVNWLNTSTGHPAAYKFTGTRGTSDYTFAAWNAMDAGYDATNPFRNSSAFYFLPTENEWVKAAYWNGTALQAYATQAGQTLMQGNGTSGAGWNYYDNRFATDPYGPWNVGSGSQELNGTYDMMGNDFEWTESPWTNGDYGASSSRGTRGGYWGSGSSSGLAASYRGNYNPSDDYTVFGFRVASVPEPSTIALLLTACIGGLLWWRRRGKA